jgi:hypothetical protein
MSTAGSEEKGTPSAAEAVIPHQFDLEAKDGGESLELTPQELRRLKRIVDWRILPYISLLYLLSEFDGIAQHVFSFLCSMDWVSGFLDRVSFSVIAVKT